MCYIQWALSSILKDKSNNIRFFSLKWKTLGGFFLRTKKKKYENKDVFYQRMCNESVGKSSKIKIEKSICILVKIGYRIVIFVVCEIVFTVLKIRTGKFF